ncbi:MAG: response regulator [Thermodesulfobacteriota bacterium]|nr:response regulator [Thermodesulfobacteriota bacterium]
MKKKILFVDDEPNILQGLKRMLRSMRDEWDISFAESGQEALDILTREDFDVVVSDMRMPRMNGAQLLDEIRILYPQIVRIVLSGHSDKEMILKSVRSTHQYLSKPCDAQKLKSTVTRACALRDLLEKDSLKRVVSQVDSLPSLPSSYSKLMDELQSSDASTKRVGDIMAKDLGMTAKVLQLVNSAFFGLPVHVSSPSQAVNLLGIDTVKALVLSAEVFSKCNQERLPGFSIESLWDHSINTGTIAKEIAKMAKIDSKLVDDAFMAGILHDIGKLIIVESLPDSYKKVLELMNSDKLSFFDAEYLSLGATHAEMGAYLLGLWGLPDPIIEAVAFHHCPSNCPGGRFGPLIAVHIANALEHEEENGTYSDKIISRIDHEYIDGLGLTEKIVQWQEVRDDIKKRGKHNE